MSTEEQMICPYNKAHVILRSRFPHHLIRCKKNYPYVVLKACPYNAMHQLVPEEFEKHLKECRDRVLIEPWRYNIKTNEQHGDLTPAPFNVEYLSSRAKHIDSSDEDDW